MLRRCRPLGLSFVLMLLVRPSLAADYDGTRPFVCAPSDIVSCTPGEGCDKETPDTINLPPLLFFDVTGGKITGQKANGEPLETAIENLRRVEDELAMQGVQGHIAWSVTVAETSGDMTLAATDERTGYVAFGKCRLR
jgi:hypothetical protein